MLTADIDPHCADIAATQHDCGAIIVAASEGGRPAAAAVRVATMGSRGWGLKRSGARRGSVGRAARGRGCMGGGMEEAATKRAAKGAGRAMRQPNPIPYQGYTRGMA